MSPIIATRASDSAQAFGFLGATGTPFALAGNYESIASFTVPTGGLTSVTFSNIPQTYAHLQVRGIARNTSHSGGGAEQNLRMQFNGDTASNYSDHWIAGDGSSASASNELTTSMMLAYGIIPMDTETANSYGTFVTDLVDYANGSKYKTIRSLIGKDTNGGGYIFLSSGNWRSTSAVTSLVLYPQAGSFAQYSSFALYGVKI